MENTACPQPPSVIVPAVPRSGIRGKSVSERVHTRCVSWSVWEGKKREKKTMLAFCFVHVRAHL